jgi:hypothetical protein
VLRSNTLPVSQMSLGGPMDHTQLPHYHIRWSGKATLDWGCFSTRAQAEASAKQLVRQEETCTIEEHNGTCPRCQGAVKSALESEVYRDQT